jgi:magnesium transporter
MADGIGFMMTQESKGMIRSLVSPVKNGNGEMIIRRNLSQDDLTAVLAEQTSVWIDIVDPTEQEIHWLQENLKLHPLIVGDLKRVDRRPSLLVYTDYIFLSLFQPEITLDNALGREIHCLIGECYFITVRGSETKSVEDAYTRAANNPNYWERDVAYFLYLTMQAVIDAYYPLVDTISNRLNTLEENQLQTAPDATVRRKLYRIKQQLIALRQMVAPQREVLSNVIGEERLTRNNENRDLFRHLYERLMRVYDVVDSQRDLSNNVLDLIQSHESQKLGNAVSRLTIFSMIFLPLTFLIGIFELNFITTDPPLSIPIPGSVMLILIITSMILSVVGMVLFFRRRGWL